MTSKKNINSLDKTDSVKLKESEPTVDFKKCSLAKTKNICLISVHFRCERNPYSDNNKDGYINFGTAQNYLIWELYKGRLLSFLPFLSEEDTHYNLLEGTLPFRQFNAHFLLKKLNLKSSPQNMIVASNFWSLFEMILFALCNKHDEVALLVPELDVTIQAIQNRTQISIKNVCVMDQLLEIINSNSISAVFIFIKIKSFEEIRELIEIAHEKQIYITLCLNDFDLSSLNIDKYQRLLLLFNAQVKSENHSFFYGACIANNQLIEKLGKQANCAPLSTLSQAFVLNCNDFSLELCPLSHDTQTPQLFLKQVAELMSVWARKKVAADDIILAAGATAILEKFAFAFKDLENGDVIIPVPYYSGFDHAFGDRAKLNIIPVETLGSKISCSDLLAALNAHKNVKLVVICSPINPTGEIYSKDEIFNLIKFAETHKIHLLFDEMYINLVFSNENCASALQFESDYVHVAWGFAKDLGLSGFKIGVGYSTNKKIKARLLQDASLSPISNGALAALGDFIDNKEWLFNIFKKNIELVQETYSICTAQLDANGIGYEKAHAGFFVWINLSSYLKEKSFEEEMLLFEYIFTEARLSISPGQLFHARTPGWFRICYATNKNTLLEGMSRLINCLNNYNKVKNYV